MCWFIMLLNISLVNANVRFGPLSDRISAGKESAENLQLGGVNCFGGDLLQRLSIWISSREFQISKDISGLTVRQW